MGGCFIAAASLFRMYITPLSAMYKFLNLSGRVEITDKMLYNKYALYGAGCCRGKLRKGKEKENGADQFVCDMFFVLQLIWVVL